MKKKIISILLAITFALSFAIVPSMAEGPLSVELLADKTNFVTSTDEQIVTISVILKNPAPTESKIAGVNFDLKTSNSNLQVSANEADIEKTDKFSNATFISNKFTGLNMDSSFHAVAIADTQITLLQFKVIIAANCPEGTYQVYTEDLVLSDVNSNSVYENNASISLTITTPHVHQWATNWTSDGTHHWHECTAEGCTLTAGTANSGKDGYAEHNWTAANCTTAKTCSICGKTEGSALGHDHNGPWVTTDEKEHWKVCAREGCNEQLDKAVHTPSAWVNVGDGYHHQTCTVCERELTHGVCTFGQPLKYNATSHWEECTKCGNKQNEAAHEFLTDSDKCTGCDYTKSSTITIITPTQPGDSKPAEGNPSTGAVSSPVGYVFVGLAVVGALCLGAKKLTKKHED